jgi:hypothetical protein
MCRLPRSPTSRGKRPDPAEVASGPIRRTATTSRQRAQFAGVAVGAALLLTVLRAGLAVTPADPCRLTLRDPARMLDHTVSAELLARTFARNELREGDVEVGEGETRHGIMVFPNDPRRRLRIAWGKLPGVQPATWLMVDGESRWRGHQDIGLATDLRTLERLNGRPFILAGFDWDYGGTVLDWRGGHLAPTHTERCRLIVRLEPSPGSPRSLVDQVVGDRDFPSDHPAMRALNPLVYQIILELP